MNPLDITAMAWEGVKSRRLRFILNLIGILIGCAAVTGLISITAGLTSTVTGQLQILGPQNIMIVPGQASNMRSMGPSGIGTSSIGWKELQIVERVSHVLEVTPIIGNKFVSYNIKGKSYRSQVYGITEAFQRINKNVELTNGREFENSDSGVVIIGANVAWPSNKDSPIISLGDRIIIQTKVNNEDKSLTVRVIGILKKTGGSLITLDDAIAMPLRDAQSFFNTGNSFTYLMAQADDVNTVTETSKAIKTRLGLGYVVVDQEQAKSSVEAVTGTISAVLGGIAAISLIVAGVGIINTMIVSVIERTKEIGTLKALGAKSRDILQMFLLESILTGFIGGLLGAVLGLVLSIVIGRIIGVEISPSLILSVEVIGFAIVTSMLSGLYPAWRASKLSPVEALRHG